VEVFAVAAVAVVRGDVRQRSIWPPTSLIGAARGAETSLYDATATRRPSSRSALDRPNTQHGRFVVSSDRRFDLLASVESTQRHSLSQRTVAACLHFLCHRISPTRESAVTTSPRRISDT
jgi:hypothetical protein